MKAADILIADLKTAEDCYKAIEDIEGDHRNVVGGSKVFYSGRRCEFTVTAKNKLASINRLLDSLIPDED